MKVHFAWNDWLGWHLNVFFSSEKNRKNIDLSMFLAFNERRNHLRVKIFRGKCINLILFLNAIHPFKSYLVVTKNPFVASNIRKCNPTVC
jgi:hypothetical protein